MSGALPRSPREQAESWLAALEAGGCGRQTALRLLAMFPSDENFALLEQSLAAGDTETAFRAAHTLKGVCGTLCLTELYGPVARLSDALKRGDADTACILFGDVRPLYRETVSALETLG